MGEVKHLTAEQVGERLGVPVWSVYELAKRGELPSLKIGRRVRFRRADLEEWESAQVERAKREAEQRRGSAG